MFCLDVVHCSGINGSKVGSRVFSPHAGWWLCHSLCHSSLLFITSVANYQLTLNQWFIFQLYFFRLFFSDWFFILEALFKCSFQRRLNVFSCKCFQFLLTFNIRHVSIFVLLLLRCWSRYQCSLSSDWHLRHSAGAALSDQRLRLWLRQYNGLTPNMMVLWCTLQSS